MANRKISKKLVSVGVETTVPEVAIELVNLEYLGILSEYEDLVAMLGG